MYSTGVKMMWRRRLLRGYTSTDLKSKNGVIIWEKEIVKKEQYMSAKDGKWCASYYDDSNKRKYIICGKHKDQVEHKLIKTMGLSSTESSKYFGRLDEGFPIHICLGQYYDYIILENLVELEWIPTFYSGVKMFTLKITPTLNWIETCGIIESPSMLAERFLISSEKDCRISTTLAGLSIDIKISKNRNGTKFRIPDMLCVDGILRSENPIEGEAERVMGQSRQYVIEKLSSIEGEPISRKEFVDITNSMIEDLKILVYDVPAQMIEEEDCDGIKRWEKIKKESDKEGRGLSKYNMQFLRDYCGIPYHVKFGDGCYLVTRSTDEN